MATAQASWTSSSGPRIRRARKLSPAKQPPPCPRAPSHTSQPPANFFFVGRVFSSKERRQYTLFGIDLEPVDVQHKEWHCQQGQRVCQEHRPSQESDREAQVHGIARESIDATANQG